MTPSFPHPLVDRILARPAQVYLAGNKVAGERVLGRRWKALIQTGTLAGAMLLQALPGPHAQALAAHLDGAMPQAVSGQGQEEAQAREAVLVNPLLQAGMGHLVRPEGIEAGEILHGWRHSDITPAQALELVQVLMVTQSPVFVRGEEGRRAAEELGARTAGIFDVSNRQEADAFLQAHGLDVLEREGAVPFAWLESYAQARVQPDAEDISDAVDAWLGAASIDGWGPDTVPNFWIREGQRPEDLEAAKARLGKAVEHTGLASLRVPLSMWASAHTLDRLAGDLEQANVDLQALTGWEGAVLGLKGRVHMMAGAPTLVGQSSFEEGHGLAVAGPLDIAEHEILIHGVGSLLALESGQETAKSFGYSIGEAVAQGQGHLLGEGARAWFELKAGVAQDMAPWRARLEAALATGTDADLTEGYARYIASPEETTAFVLEVIAAHKLGHDSPLVHPTDGTRLFAPGMSEALASQWRFEAAFATLKDAWWDRLSEAGANMQVLARPAREWEVSAPSLQSWRQARRFSMPDPIEAGRPKGP